MFGVFANDTNDAAAMDDFALIADLLDGRADLHNFPFNAADVKLPTMEQLKFAMITARNGSIRSCYL